MLLKELFVLVVVETGKDLSLLVVTSDFTRRTDSGRRCE